MTNEQLCALAKQGNADAQNLLIENNLPKYFCTVVPNITQSERFRQLFD